jgi:hypothetical protein
VAIRVHSPTAAPRSDYRSAQGQLATAPLPRLSDRSSRNEATFANRPRSDGLAPKAVNSAPAASNWHRPSSARSISCHVDLAPPFGKDCIDNDGGALFQECPKARDPARLRDLP